MSCQNPCPAGASRAWPPFSKSQMSQINSEKQKNVVLFNMTVFSSSLLETCGGNSSSLGVPLFRSPDREEHSVSLECPHPSGSTYKPSVPEDSFE